MRKDIRQLDAAQRDRPQRAARALAGALALLAVPWTATASPAAAAGRPAAATQPAGMRAACSAPRPGLMRCYALYERQAQAATPGSAAAPAGWGASDIESAYKVPAGRDPHQAVAVVEAYSTPQLAASLAAYRTQYGLPACGTQSGCLRVVNQDGLSSPLPASGVPSGWDVETSLDVSMVSAACPQCKILVVAARSPSLADLAAAQDTAARLGAAVISDSYGSPESGQALARAGAYDHPGHVIVAASGDTGFTAASFPADLPAVTAAGGTQLSRAANRRGWDEQAWENPAAGATGSGCSAYVAKPAWQHDPHCGMRTVADVSALAWNVAVNDQDRGGWLLAGGTSAAAPLIAGIYALAGNAATITPGYEYRHAGSLFDVTAGNNDWLNGTSGATCGYDYLCVAGNGYDAPSGLGTPDGTGAF